MKDFIELELNIKLRLITMFIALGAFSTVEGSMTIYYNQHMGVGITGILLIIGSIVSFLTGLLAGHWSDLHGRRPMIVSGNLIAFIGMLFAILANTLFFNPWLTFIGFMLESFGSGLCGTSLEAMVVDLTDSESRKKVYALQYWVINLAIAFGVALSGWLFRDYFDELLMLIAVAYLTNLIITFWGIRETFQPVKHHKTHQSNIFKAYFQVSKDKIFMIYMVSLIGGSMFNSAVSFFLPVHLSNTFRTTNVLGTQVYGQRMLTIMLMLNTIFVIIFMPIIRQFTKNWSTKNGIVIGTTLEGAGLVLALFSHSFSMEMIAILLDTSGEMIAVAFLQALTANLMKQDAAGVYTGAVSITYPIANFIAGMVVSGTMVYGDYGLGVVMIFVTLLTIFPALIALKMHHQRLLKLTNR